MSDDLESGCCQDSDQSQQKSHPGEKHYINRANWLRAAVLGANDGIVSVGSILMGVSQSDRHSVILAGVSALVGGALSMALGELVSVYSQKDTERADIAREIAEQNKGPEARERELTELQDIYIKRGVETATARSVAEQLTKKDVIRAHARDELGIDVDDLSSPWQAASVSCVSFALGAAIPLLSAVFITSNKVRVGVTAGSSIIALTICGGTGSILGGAAAWVGASRVVIGGVIALGTTYGIGRAIQ